MEAEDSRRHSLATLERPLGTSVSGHLNIDGADALDLANRYGTPLFVFMETVIRQNYRRFASSLCSAYPKSRIFYACKANGLLAILKILLEEDCGIDVVSEGELYLAQRAGFPTQSIVFNGNSKSDSDILLGLSSDLLFNVDSIDELKAISTLAVRHRRDARVCLRVIPDVHSRTISEFATGIPESKFGLDIRTGEAWRAAKEALALSRVRLVGLHCHIGSQIESVEPYLLAVESVLTLADKMKRDLGCELVLINMGGGFGIPFTGSEGSPSIEQFATSMGGYFASIADSYGMDDVWLGIEPGGALVGKAGVVLLTVNSVKSRENGDTWVAVDGGADVLLRATQGWYSFPIISAEDPCGTPQLTANVAGPLCYSGDVLARGVALPAVCRGSRLAVLDAGAYTLSILNAYNARLSPAVVVVRDGNVRLVRRRGRPVDLVAQEETDALNSG
ncbi:MAG: diaminopimelate decarboxylase [Ignavibacteriales bacterium]